MTFVRRLLWVLTAAYWVVIFVLTHIPPHAVPRTNVSDKLQHFLAYFVLAFMLGVTLRLTFPRRPGLLWLVVPVGMLYGLIDERTQIFVQRTADLDDWVADSVGAGAAATLLWVLTFLASSARDRRPVVEEGEPAAEPAIASSQPPR